MASSNGTSAVGGYDVTWTVQVEGQTDPITVTRHFLRAGGTVNKSVADTNSNGVDGSFVAEVHATGNITVSVDVVAFAKATVDNIENTTNTLNGFTVSFDITDTFTNLPTESSELMKWFTIGSDLTSYVETISAKENNDGTTAFTIKLSDVTGQTWAGAATNEVKFAGVRRTSTLQNVAGMGVQIPVSSGTVGSITAVGT